MKVMIVEGRYKDNITIPVAIIKKLPYSITIAAAVQYLDALPFLTKQLAEHGIKTKLFKGLHSKYPGQIVGCDIVTADETDACLYIGDGLFHPKTLVLKGNKPVHCYSPETNEYKLITPEDVQDIISRHNTARMKFIEAKTIGILVTMKYGQNNLKAALAIKQYFRGKKEVVVFLTETLDWNDLENYPFVELWVNTMCPRISYDDQPRFRKLVLDLADAVELIRQIDPQFSPTQFLAARDNQR